LIGENLAQIKRRISEAGIRAGRKPAEITIVAVSKGRSVEEIKQAVSCGMADIGENRVQEASVKYNQLKTYNLKLKTLRWHMIGHLQSNKAKDAVKIFDLIHSVDSLRLAEEIDKQAQRLNKVQDVLIEVKTSPEDTKSGMTPEDVPQAIKEIIRLKNINIKGLMTIAPAVDNPETARPYFKTLRELRGKVTKLGICDLEFGILSMGMTDDFEVAIEEGADILRLGRAIYE